MNTERPEAVKRSNRQQVWAKAIQRIRMNLHLGKDFDRNTATRMVQALDAERQGDNHSSTNVKKRSAYKFYKNFFRICRISIRLSDRVFGYSEPETNTFKKINGSFIYSNAAFSKSMFDDYLNASTSAVFIFHDDIGLKHPEYAINSGTIGRIRPKVRKLREIGSLALCVSSYSEDCLRVFDEEIGTSDQPTHRLSMPSMLYLGAAKDGRMARISGGKPFILYCSTIEARKNHILLAEVWKDALESGISIPPLYCVGKWGWGVEKLSEFMEANPQLGSHVHFLGQVSDEKLIDLYRSALFSVYPSHLEGWGLGASESLDFGLPVIISTAKALKEASHGLMPAIAPDDKDAWLQQIRLLAENGDALAKLRQIIGDRYRPVSEEESWADIKAALRNWRH